MRKRKSQEEPTQAVRFVMELTLRSVADVEVPADVLGDPNKEQAIVRYIRTFEHDSDLGEEFDYRVDKLDSPWQPNYRAVQRGGYWELDPIFKKGKLKRSLSTFHLNIVNLYDGVKPLEYSFVPCLSETDEIGEGVAYYCDGFIMIMVLWRESWEVAVLEGFDRQYPINQACGAIPISRAMSILKKDYNYNTTIWENRIDHYEAYEAMIKAGMPSISRGYTPRQLPDKVASLPPRCDAVVTPETMLANIPGAFFVRDESTDSDAG